TPPPHPLPAPPRAVPPKKQPALPRADHIQIAIAVDVDDRDLHPAAHPAAEVDDVAHPLESGGTASRRSARPVLEPIDAERFAFAWIVAVVRHEALAGDEVQLLVAIEIDQRRGMAL